MTIQEPTVSSTRSHVVSLNDPIAQQSCHFQLWLLGEDYLGVKK